MVYKKFISYLIMLSIIFYYLFGAFVISCASPQVTIESAKLSSNSDYVDITFSEGVYGDNSGTTPLEISDFELIFTNNDGTATDINIQSLTNNEDSQLIGGEQVIRINLAISGSINGLEYIEIKPVKNSIYGSNGIKVKTTETTGNIYLENINSWQYNKRIFLDTTINGVNIENDIINFPLLVKLDSNNFDFDNANNDGSDIRFFYEDLKLYYEIEKWDKQNSEAYIWVLIPSVNGNDNTQSIIMYWGNNSAAEQTNGENVFNNNYLGVWHLNEDGNTENGGYSDSTGSNFDLTGIGIENEDDVNAVIANGQNLSGSNSYINGVDNENLRMSSDFTISFWMKTNSNASDWVRLVGKGNSSDRNYGVWLNRSNNKILFQQYGSSNFNLNSASATSNGQWHYITVNVNGDTAKIFIDGIEDASADRNITPATSYDPLTIGYAGFHTYYNGTMDEVRISDNALSNDFIKLSYENQKQNQDFLTFETNPRIVNYNLAMDNSYIDLTYNEGVFGNNDGTVAVDKDDFNVLFNSNGGEATNVTINSITKTDGEALAGGETTLRLNLAITGTPSGVESIEIMPQNDESIFNITGKSSFSDDTTGSINLYLEIEDIIIDNTDDKFTMGGNWVESTAVNQYYGANYLHDGTSSSDGSNIWAKWTPEIIKEGRYKVYLRWASSENRPDRVPVEINYRSGIDYQTINQQQNGGTWNLMGTYDFETGNNGYIKLLTSDAGYTIADALKIEYVGGSYANWSNSSNIYLDTTQTGANVSENVGSFPVLISLTNSNFNFNEANNNGSDIRFSDNEGNELNYEIESWNFENKVAKIWVLVPIIYGNNKNQYIKIYWGNDEAESISDGENVFQYNNNFVGVWHLNENGTSDTGGYNESTDNSFNGTGVNMTENSDNNGIIAKAQNFTGTEYIKCGDDNKTRITGDITISFWMKTDSTSSDWVRLVGKGNSTNRNYGVWLNRSNNKILFQQYGSSNFNIYSSSSTVNGEWSYVTVTVSGSDAKVFMDGTVETNGTRNITPKTSSDELTIGYAGFHTYYKGTIDEVRISNTSRSEAWIKLCYENQKSNQNLVNFQTRPNIESFELSYDNSYLDIIFTEGVYTNIDGSGGINKDDFTVIFKQNEGNNIPISIQNVTNTDGLSLSGGETSIRIHFSITGTPTGDETIEIKPKDSSSIYSDYGMPILYSQSTGEINLNRVISGNIIVDNTDPNFTSSGNWVASTAVNEYYGQNYFHDGTSSADNESIWAKWTPEIPADGLYEIYMNWTASSNRPDNAPLEISYDGGIDNGRTVNQKIDGGEWNYIGRYRLSEGTDNYVKIIATDSGHTIADAVKFVYIGGQFNEWLYSKNIFMDTTIDGANINTNINNFPANITLDNSNFDFDQANDDGSDLRFSDTGGNSLSYEVENWDKANEKAEIWVKIPLVVANNDTQYIRMYWGNSEAESESNGANVFSDSNGFKGVWHLDENGNNSLNGYLDSSSYLHHCTGENTYTESDVESVVSNGQHLKGGNEYINGVDSSELRITGDITISFWMNTKAAAGDWVRLVGKGNSTHRNYGVWLNNNNTILLFQQYNSGSAVINLQKNVTGIQDNWKYVVATVDNSDAKLYLDGENIGSGTRSNNPSTNTNPFTIGYAGFHTYYNGIIDEVIVSDVARSADWVKLCYENQKDNQTFINVERSPMFNSFSLASDNSYVDIEFSEGLYGTPNGTGAIDENDFTVEVVRNGGNDISANITEIVNTDNTELAGGESQVRMKLNISGSPIGIEKIVISPVGSSSVFNISGSAMESSQNSGEITVNRVISSIHIIDNTDDSFSTGGSWSLSTSVSGYYGSNYSHDGTGTSDDITKWAKWTPSITRNGFYEVYMKWTSSSNRPDAAPVEIGHKDGVDSTKTVNQKLNNGSWNLIGTYEMEEGSNNYVKILTSDNGYTIADAVKIVYIGNGTFNEWLFNTKVYLDTTESGANTSSDIENFPVLIRLNENNFNFSLAKTDGTDIRFTDMLDNELSYEIERWDIISNTAELWVKVPQISGNNNGQYINMYWGNMGAFDNSNGENVFANNFEGVWHLNQEESGIGNENIYLDSTENNFDMTDNIGSTQRNGLIGYGKHFDGNDYLEGNSQMFNFDYEDKYTLYAWVNPSNTNAGTIASKMSNGSPYAGWDMFTNGNIGGHLINSWSSNALKETTTNSINTNQWNQVAITYDGTHNFDGYKVYIDGIEQNTNIDKNSLRDSSLNNSIFKIGSRDGGRYFTGSIDELQISNVDRTSDWIKLSYENQKTEQNFVNVVPCIVNVTSTVDNGTYKIGDEIDIKIEFSSQIDIDTASGEPHIELETGDNDKNAVYSEKTDSKTLSFTYTIAEGDLSDDLDYKSIDSMVLNGAVITNNNYNAETKLLKIRDLYSLGINKDIEIDGIKPVIENLVLNNGEAQTEESEIEISIIGVDIGSGLKEGKIIISENANFTGNEWEEYSSDKIFNLSEEEGRKDIFIKLKDKAGNESEVYNDSILYGSAANTKYFRVNSHEVRTPESNLFYIGDYVPIKLSFSALYNLSNPVLNINLRLKKSDDSNTGIYIVPYKDANGNIDTSKIRVYKNGNYDIELSKSLILENEHLKFRITEDINLNDLIEVHYIGKLTADSNVLSQGLNTYIENNNINQNDIYLNFEISELTYDGENYTIDYNKNSELLGVNEEYNFSCGIKAESPDDFN